MEIQNKTNMLVSKAKSDLSWFSEKLTVSNIKTIDDARKSKQPSLAKLINIKKAEGESGEMEIKRILQAWIVIGNEELDIKSPMSKNHIIAASEDILQDYYYLKPNDIVLFFKMLSRGEFGELYESFNLMKFSKFLKEYVDIRFSGVQRERDMERDRVSAIESNVPRTSIK